MPIRARNGYPTLLAIGTIALAAILAYSNSFSGAFVFDDDASIAENPTIRSLWPIWAPFVPPNHGETVTGRPMLNFTLAVNYAMSGTKTWSYHAGNLLIHIGAALMLFGIVRRTLLLPSMRRRWRKAALPLAFATALLWAVHPLQTESVTYIVQRAESLMALLYLATLYCVIRGARSLRPQSTVWYVAASLACLAGMATKEVMASAPVIVFFYDRAFLAGSFRAAWQKRRSLYLVFAGTWLLLGWLILSGAAAVGIGIGMTWHAYLCTQFGAIVHYLRLCVWPDPLLFHYGIVVAKGVWGIVPYAIVIVSLAIAAVFALWRWPKAGFLGLCFFAILAPSSSVVPACVVQTVAEHRMYLPSTVVLVCLVFLAYLAGLTAVRRGVLSAHAAQITGIAAATAIAMAFMVLTFQRNFVYHSVLSVWEDTVAKAPDNAQAYVNYGLALAERNRLEEACNCFRKSIQLMPRWERAYNDLGNILFRQGRIDEAVAEYEKALNAKPEYASALNNLGNVALHRHDVDKAVAYYRRALEINPSHADAHNNLGIICASRGQFDEAVTHFQKAVEGKPNDRQIRANLNRALMDRQRLAGR
jgi:tetratricopeptide (TPR) repeat protein